MKTVEKANQFIQTEKGKVNPIFKPQAHLTPETGWMNDPNGFIYFRGEYHLFYQFNPYESVWGPMHWGHAKSKDLVNWEQLPVALAPDKDYDKDGCFSGSAIVKDDVLWLMYTGHINNEDGTVSQVQNMAFSTDGIHFEKIEQNPVATADGLPEEVIANDFRDPKIFEKDGHYYSVVATKHKDNVGCIVLLSSPNLTDWKFESIFLKGEANQGFVWECPDYFEVDGQEYLIISPMRYQKDGNDFVNINSNIFVTGHVDWDKKVFVADSFKEIDHGHDFYAAQTTEGPEGERVMIAWMHTWGRELVTNDLGHKWYGQMTLPRILKKTENGLHQVLPTSVLEAFSDIEIGQSIQGPSKLSLRLEDSLELKLGSDQDYLQFGYDKAKQEVYIDRSSLKIQQVGEEEWSTVRRAVTVQATDLLVLVDTNCVEILVNDGQETLTSTFYVDGQIILNAL
ncbi:TPA: glycoside hydrolase family 32 protein [Streptococcus suis]|uniref:glycoside hydrolase family 32 protein n=1 Tax=Streptococcus suis TaxID=1307 RepID=UPI0004297A29|nr:glycoside hydrolase family 32 protein [Streptococcus suis]NQM01095.1 glycoside hydrolase family 32 protein [Streptococcus suis]HEM3198243.1 glycoside hydrolase family 32 protein [Streptococcus suis 14A]HEM4285749.1 glycoside hydrolase family 32 protein [Streptococcus suis]HEM6216651.1 glycoside hydrolase family 32 protein [Streptococcus suis]HEM6242346.1 glycoside hydrolase family 32 protein [Streptococcus suis]